MIVVGAFFFSLILGDGFPPRPDPSGVLLVLLAAILVAFGVFQFRQGLREQRQQN